MAAPNDDVAAVPGAAEASADEKARFTKSLHSINEWYVDPITIVLLVTTPAPAGQQFCSLLLPSFEGATAATNGHSYVWSAHLGSGTVQMHFQVKLCQG